VYLEEQVKTQSAQGKTLKRFTFAFCPLSCSSLPQEQVKMQSAKAEPSAGAPPPGRVVLGPLPLRFAFCVLHFDLFFPPYFCLLHFALCLLTCSSADYTYDFGS
jgi:hypothetical protein